MRKEIQILDKNFEPKKHYDIQLESDILGVLLLVPTSLIRVYNLLQEEYFHTERNRYVFRAIKWMYSNNKPMDITTILYHCHDNMLKEWNEIAKEDELVPYIVGLRIPVVTDAHLEFWCKILIDLWANKMMLTAQMSDTKDAYEYAEKIKQAYQINKTDTWLTQSDVFFEKLMPRMDAAKSGKIISFLTGIQGLDNRCKIDAGEYIVLGARPSMGKTALAMQIATNIAKNESIVGIISLETNSERLEARLIAGESKIEYWKIWKNKLSEQENKYFFEMVDKMIQLPILISDTPAVTSMDVRIQAKKLKQKYPDKKMVIIIDYLQLITPQESGKKNRVDQLGEISRAIRLLTMELKDTAVIALAQLNRDAEKEKPALHHLRESGAIEQDADKIFFLHRNRDAEDELKNQGQIDDFDADLIIAKSKEGWTGNIPLLFSPQTMTFRDKNHSLRELKPIGEVQNYYEQKSGDEPF